MLQFPNGTPMAKKISEDRRKRLTDVHTILVSHFRTLNAIHTRLQDLPDPNIRVRSIILDHTEFVIAVINLGSSSQRINSNGWGCTGYSYK